MKISNGTPEAMNLFAELKTSGDLVDVYSEDFFKRQPTYEEDPLAPFTKDGMITIEEMENDSDEDAKPKKSFDFHFC